MRDITFELNYVPSAAGSVLVSCGNTRVIVTVSAEDRAPGWMRGTGRGWLSAEYDMLPGAGNSRKRRNRNGVDGRSKEIERLIGRSLRMAIDLDAIGEQTLWIDCDVLQADGGTRTASINGAMVALVLALRKLKAQKKWSRLPIKTFIGAISVGICDDAIVVDLDYVHDSNAQADTNLVMNSEGQFIEVQGTAERKPFDLTQLNDILSQGQDAITDIIAKQKAVLGYSDAE